MALNEQEHYGNDADSLTLSGVPNGALPYALSALLKGEIDPLPANKTILHVTVNDRALDQLAHLIPFFVKDVEILKLPAWDCLPYDRVSPRASLMAERVEALAALATRSPSAKTPLVVLTTVAALLQKLPPVEQFRKAVLRIEKGAALSRDALVTYLQQNGFRQSGKAIEPGEYAVRGGIVDIVPPGAEAGVRLDFFGDEIESLRAFDPLTQRSSEEVNILMLHPAGEIALNEESIQRFRTGYRDEFGAISKEDPLYEAVSSGQHYPGMEHWLPLFYERLETLPDYVPGALLTLDSEAEKAITERQETIADYYDARQAAMTAKNMQGVRYNPLPPTRHFVMEAGWENITRRHHHLTFSPFMSDKAGVIHFGCKTSPNLVAARSGGDMNPFAQLRQYALDKRAEGKSTILAALSAGSAERLTHLLSEQGTHVVRIDHWSDRSTVSPKAVGVATLPLESGFECDDIVLISEADLLGERIIRAKTKKKSSEIFLAEAANFSEGELVVHREHGISRFEGLVTLEVGATKHDCLKLVYADDDKLFLPVENIELVSRFGAEEEGVRLDKLGAASWQARKARMKERIRLAAEQLMKIAAARMVQDAPALVPPPEKYDAFVRGFGYVETEDQERSIEEVVEDLRLGRPMDRLICGDVGFGKTEVALRAAFAAVYGNANVGTETRFQVAVVVPTTLLARQHYKNFVERFAGFGICVRQLSRMVPAKEQKETIEELADGSVDIVIGTHALLSERIKFAQLGLVIVDEEQHFGVGQKEKLKELKANVHVLTLSATPIPRTLQLALTGVRQLSLITTPPVDRLATRSFVMPWDDVVLREAIMRELHRGGRVFFCCPRIKDIAEVKQNLLNLVPEAKLGVAHGQMTPTELDTIMTDFSDGKLNLLLSTAIIESGLDIPEANTMIIYRADRFGLSQLYQLRGRVGRGKIRAYAYFLLPPHAQLTQNATKRLEVMQSLDTLGAGFTLASHDMDIRGFGNLVGEEQSGHIREVGVELYQHMLEEAVSQLRTQNKAEAQEEEFSPQINLGLSVLIPEDYVEDLGLRMGLYRRAGALATPEEIDAFSAELTDRFGTPPQEVNHLLQIVALKQLCKRAGIERLDAGPKGAVITFHKDRFANPEALLIYLSKHPTRLKLRPDQKLVYMQQWRDKASQMDGVKKLLSEIGGLV